MSQTPCTPTNYLPIKGDGRTFIPDQGNPATVTEPHLVWETLRVHRIRNNVRKLNTGHWQRTKA